MVGRGGTGCNSSGHWKTPDWSKRRVLVSSCMWVSMGPGLPSGIALEPLCLVGLWNCNSVLQKWGVDCCRGSKLQWVERKGFRVRIPYL